MISGESQFQRSGGSPAPGCGWMPHALAGPPVEAAQPAVLELGVDDVRVLRVDLAVEAVAADWTTNQSAFMMPWTLRVRAGPPSV